MRTLSCLQPCPGPASQHKTQMLYMMLRSGGSAQCFWPRRIPIAAVHFDDHHGVAQLALKQGNEAGQGKGKMLQECDKKPLP